ncbi:hypothetical protein [Chitinophaga sp.]|nr:hypothetical protein [Chitinophaga sp.]
MKYTILFSSLVALLVTGCVPHQSSSIADKASALLLQRFATVGF